MISYILRIPKIDHSPAPVLLKAALLTIYVPLILQEHSIIFLMRAKHIIIHLEGCLEELKTFL